MMLSSLMHKTKLIILLNWIAVLPTRQSYFMRISFSEAFLDAKKFSMLTIHILLGVSIMACISTILLLPAYAYFFMDSYVLPAHCHLPFLKPVNVLTYLINFIQHLYVGTTIMLCWYLMNCCFIIILIHFYAHLDAIKVLVGNMEEGIRAGDYQKWLKSIKYELNDFNKYE